jgi:hypothetical protein
METTVKILNSVLDRLDSYFDRQEMKRYEAYLAQSENLADLERRMREFDRRSGRDCLNLS